MSGLNRVLLIGRLTADPDLRFTQGGQAVLNCRMAVNESFLNRDGERQDRVEYVAVTIWGKRGEGLNKVLEKGSQLCVEGRLQTRSWEDKSGNKRYTTEVVATNIVLLGGGRGGEGGGRRGRSRDDDAPPPSNDYGSGGGGGFDDSDDIPF